MTNYLFVYGTLRKEFAPPEISSAVKKFKYVGKGYIHGRLYDLGEYPGAITDRGIREKVFGLIYEIPVSHDSIFPQLDNYEEFNPKKKQKSLFLRKLVAVHRPGQPTLKSWAYIYNRNVKTAKLIADGDYSKVAA